MGTERCKLWCVPSEMALHAQAEVSGASLQCEWGFRFGAGEGIGADRAFLAPHSQWLFSGEDHPGQVSCPTFRKANGRGVAATWLCWAGPAVRGTRCWSARRCLAHGNMGAPSPYKQQLLAVRCLRAHTIQGKRGRLLSNLAPFPFLPFQLLLSFVLRVCGCLIWSYLQWQRRVLCLW